MLTKVSQKKKSKRDAWLSLEKKEGRKADTHLVKPPRVVR